MPVINQPAAIPEPAPGACEWPVDTTCCPDWATYSLEIRERAEAWAVEILSGLTGRRFGQCPVNYRPCGPKCLQGFGYISFPVSAPSSGSGFPWMTPFIDAGVWRNCGCSGGCTCKAACEVPFPGSVAAVQEVRIDGVVLDPSAYRLDSYRGSPVLVRTDGDCWPVCQDMAADIDAVGSFVIVYQPGELLPQGGQLAAGALACEFARACVGGDCVLPSQLASMSRNGVEVQVVDPTQFFENGLTGNATVDRWLRAVNPTGRQYRTRFWSPDTQGPRFSG